MWWKSKGIAFCVLLTAVLCGCAAPFMNGQSPTTTAQSRPGTSAIQIPQAQYDAYWEKTVRILNGLHFQVARESKLEGVIESEYRGGSGLLEPWHKDSIGFRARLESSLQSIRRKVIVRFQESAPGTVVVGVQVLKEIEDLNGLAAGSQGAATFTEGDILNRDLDRVVGETGTSLWLPRGSDPALQAEIARRIRF
ncbi:MAG: hypothetical protein ABJZ55_09970 [Fuerstiella sp.]